MATRHGARSVLIIEDEADIRNFAFRVLQLEGYRVLQAGDGNEGLRLAKANRGLSLVLLDMRLPGRDGWAVLQEMKRDPAIAAIPVVVFSALAAPWQQKKALGMVKVSDAEKAAVRALYVLGGPLVCVTNYQCYVASGYGYGGVW